MDFSCDPVKCLECGIEFPYSNGYFVSHLRRDHNLSLRDYVVKYEYENNENKVPKCQCGYCNEPVPFHRGKFLEGQKLRKHQNYEWLKEQYIKKHGVPKCESCGADNDNFYRGYPRKNCSYCVAEGRINQKDKSVFKTYKKTKKTIKEKYGVSNPMHLLKNRNKSRERMIKNNPMKNSDTAYKAANTFCSRIDSGEISFYKNKKYKETNLNYQSSYELDFLELCDKTGILESISNGKWHKFIEQDKIYGENTITDFCFGDDYEIEIKSSYILKRQGGIKKLFAKKRAVENKGKKFIFILDKDYSEFLDIIKK